jgi:transcriptional regulator with XRE-family HTH domain
MNISEQLKSYMRASGQSTCGIARATGINKAAISRFLAGKRSLGLVSLEKLAQHLGYELRLSPLAEKSKGR